MSFSKPKLPTPAPVQELPELTDDEITTAAAEERKRELLRRGRASTLLSNPVNEPVVAKKTLLG